MGQAAVFGKVEAAKASGTASITAVAAGIANRRKIFLSI
jgi:hypothetical protein